jgi:hypothetical protein
MGPGVRQDDARWGIRCDRAIRRLDARAFVAAQAGEFVVPDARHSVIPDARRANDPESILTSNVTNDVRHVQRASWRTPG